MLCSGESSLKEIVRPPGLFCEPGSDGLVVTPLEKRAEQIIECHQCLSCDVASFSFRIWQRNHSPALPSTEQKRPLALSMVAFTPHHEFPALIVFENEPFTFILVLLLPRWGTSALAVEPTDSRLVSVCALYGRPLRTCHERTS